MQIALLVACASAGTVTPPTASAGFAHAAPPAVHFAERLPLHRFLWIDPQSDPGAHEADAVCAWRRGRLDGERFEAARAGGHLNLAFLQIAPDGIRTESAELLPLRDGVIPAHQRHGQLVSALYDHALHAADALRAACGDAASGEVLLEMDRSIPLDTLLAVLFTLEQARFDTPYLVVEEEPARAGSAAVRWPDARAVRIDVR